MLDFMDPMIVHRKSSELYANDNVFEYACAKVKVSSLGYGFLAEPALPKFKLDGDETTERIKAFLERYLVPPKHIVFSTASLNIVINHLISHPCYIVEVEKDYLLPVFDELKTTLPNTVLLNPTEKTFRTYWKNGTIILRPLATKAPIASDGSYRIEKLIVDLILSWQIRAFYSRADIEPALEVERKGQTSVQGYPGSPQGTLPRGHPCY